jgi:hypothetical protein
MQMMLLYGALEKTNICDIHRKLQALIYFYKALTNSMTTWVFQQNAIKSVIIIFIRGPLSYDKTIEIQIKNEQEQAQHVYLV